MVIDLVKWYSIAGTGKTRVMLIVVLIGLTDHS